MTAGQYLWSQGMEHGVEHSKLTIAKTMLQDNLSREQISKWTGLDLGRIDMLRDTS
ncbi:MAG: hypothetical protein AAFV97_01875 [Bacteroidota bacterium]